MKKKETNLHSHYLVNAPTGFAFPLILAKGKAVISNEPDSDNTLAPFLLKPLVGDIPANAVNPITNDFGLSLNFTAATVNR